MPPIWKHVTVGTSPILLLGAQKDRIELALYNLSSNLVYWDHHPTVSSSTGGPMTQYQGYILLEADGDMVHEPIYCVSAFAGNIVAVYEVIGQRASWQKLWDMR